METEQKKRKTLKINLIRRNTWPPGRRGQFSCVYTQGGQSRDTHVVISHILFTFCARLKVCLTNIFVVCGGVQK